MNYILYCRLSLPSNNHRRIQLGAANTLDEFKRIVGELKKEYMPYHNGKLVWEHTTEPDTQNLILPPWLCQPYIRMLPEEHLKKVEEKKREIEEANKIVLFKCI